ncbi:hypothetical protein AVEN_47186-1 [Araneus ventricosus]|uniref:Uncharacterized protein n=1 Tax=Araneus ventricosus TaxID=182803 RepID=A0A4Y2EFD8_ARAVE|nr:hypothetical protein AVEN_47186-1 [Araneus ventricosus]
MTRATPELTGPFPDFRSTPAGGRLPPMYDLTCNRPTYTADVQWNQVSNLELSGPEVETLPIGDRVKKDVKVGIEADYHNVEVCETSFSGGDPLLLKKLFRGKNK